MSQAGPHPPSSIRICSLRKSFELHLSLGAQNGQSSSAYQEDQGTNTWMHSPEETIWEQFDEDDLSGIPDLVEAIKLQATGPAEAARAIRKKLKYGNIHRQL